MRDFADVSTVIVWVFLSCFAAVGVIFVLTDYRYFDEIHKACKQVGHIQNNKTRIYCYVEDN